MGYGAGTDRKLESITTVNHGVFSIAQAIELGVAKSVVIERASSDRLFRVYRAAYSPTRKVTHEGIWMAGVLSAGGESLISHMSALRLWGISQWIGPTEVLRPSSPGSRGRADSSPGFRGSTALTTDGGRIPVLKIRSTRRLDQAERTRLRGIPVTTVARTFVDVCGHLGRGQLEDLLHEAARRKLVDLTQLRAAMDRARGKRGVRKLREIVDGWDPRSAPTRTELERRFLDLCRAGGLPMPLVTRTLAGYEVDFFWPEFRLVAETDGARDHDAPRGFERDRERDADLQLRGFRVLRLTWRMLVGEPERTIEKVRKHLELTESGRR